MMADEISTDFSFDENLFEGIELNEPPLTPGQALDSSSGPNIDFRFEGERNHVVVCNDMIKVKVDQPLTLNLFDAKATKTVRLFFLREDPWASRLVLGMSRYGPKNESEMDKKWPLRASSSTSPGRLVEDRGVYEVEVQLKRETKIKTQFCFISSHVTDEDAKEGMKKKQAQRMRLCVFFDGKVQYSVPIRVEVQPRHEQVVQPRTLKRSASNVDVDFDESSAKVPKIEILEVDESGNYFHILPPLMPQPEDVNSAANLKLMGSKKQLWDKIVKTNDQSIIETVDKLFSLFQK